MDQTLQPGSIFQGFPRTDLDVGGLASRPVWGPDLVDQGRISEDLRKGDNLEFDTFTIFWRC